jgi:phage anti-repressor protein
MNDLITVTEHEGKLAINARDLYQRLEVGRDFPTWIKDRIEKYGLVEGEDYRRTKVLSSPNLGSSKSRPQTMIEYLLVIGTAKEIVAGENNAKSREIRRLLVKIEEAWNTPEAVRLRAIQMGLIPSPATLPQISGGMNKATITSSEDFMDALWLYSVGIISRADLIRFRFGAAVEPSGEELELDPLRLWWTLEINALRQLKAMPNDDFPLSGAKLEGILRGKGKSASGMLVRQCAYGTPYEEKPSYSREAALILAARYYEIYETGFEEQEFTRFSPVKQAYERLRSNYQQAIPSLSSPAYLWPLNSHAKIAEIRYLFEAGAYNAKKVRAELFGNQFEGDQKALPQSPGA